eukprot:5507559-Amphidinium_carterae.1
MTEPTVVDVLCRLGAVSGASADGVQIKTWAEVCKAAMFDAAMKFVEQNSHRHILQQFSCDTTPLKVHEQVAWTEHGMKL